MLRPLGRIARRAAALVAALCILAPGARAAVSEHAPALKALQLRLLREEMHERAERAERTRRAALGHPTSARPRGPSAIGSTSGVPGRSGAPAREAATSRAGARARAPREGEVPGPDGRLASTLATIRPLAAAALAPNVRANDPAGEVAGTCQSETAIVADGLHVLVAWNDGAGTDTQGYAWSVDGGDTFTDGGVPPKATSWRWASDPVLAVDERTHAFYFCALIDVGLAQNGIGIVRATFAGGTLLWDTPHLVAVGDNSTVAYDKQWLAVDTTTHVVHVVYTRFSMTDGGDQIEYLRSLDGGTSWGSRAVLSDVALPGNGGEYGSVQGARVVANQGRVTAMYYSIGGVAADFFKVRRSIDGGATWAPRVTAASVFSNFASGAPGFNRGLGIDFAGMALDRSAAHPGRVYLAWPEAVDFYADALGDAGPRSEVETNATPATATPFVPGQTLRGSVGATGDLADYWQFTGTPGQTLVCFVDSISTALDGWLRLYCADGTRRLALSVPGAGSSIGATLVFSLPASGTYYLRIAANSGQGGYRLRTGFHVPIATDRARDHRDVFVSWSDDGTTWASPVRVNDGPAGFDDWLPEVAVDAVGAVHVAWYDWRDSPAGTCGGESHLYLAQSIDGGTTWTTRGAVSDALSDWNAVNSNLAPNQGDYLALYADASSVFAAWSDGRSGGTAGSSPDVYAARMTFAPLPVTVTLVGASATSSRITVQWVVSSAVRTATAYRSIDGGPWVSLGARTPDADGFLTLVDSDVTPGTRYDYRLGVTDTGGSETFYGQTSLVVPLSIALAIDRISPNPAAREIHVAFVLPEASVARLELLDIGGRLVRSLALGAPGPGPHTADLGAGAALHAGVYLVRLVQGDRSVSARVTIVP